MEQISIPTAEKLREKAAEIVAGSDYQLKNAQSDQRWMVELLLQILEWILVPFFWLFKATEGLPDVLRWIIVLSLAIITILLIAHICYSLIIAIQGPKRLSPVALESRRRGIQPTELERLAGEAAARSDFITAIRFLFRACVVRLELVEKKSNRPGTTNRELLRRYQNRPQLSDALRQFVDTIDRKWYGDEICSREEYHLCESAHGEVCRSIVEPANAIGP